VLIARDLIAVPAAAPAPASPASLATVAANVAYYGFALSGQAYAALARTGEAELATWWADVESVLAALTGDDKPMAEFVVYKNFPAEVLAMDQVTYWSRQILMYWGLPNELVTEQEQERAPLADAPAPRVLHLADDASLQRIRDELFALPARWTDAQWDDVAFLAGEVDETVDLATVAFVENRIRLAALLCERGTPATVQTATDVLRLAAALSDGDISLRKRGRLRRFTRRERRYLLGMLEAAAHLDEDVARRREQFKRLLYGLHPGDYHDAYPRVVAAYSLLYTGATVPSFAAEVERLLAARDREVLTVLATRPGEFARRLRALVDVFGADTAAAFPDVATRLSTLQLLKLRRYLDTVDARRWRTFPPRGNWSRLQVVEADEDRRLPAGVRETLLATIGAELTRRLADVGPVALAPEVERVKLPTNDAELAPYGRGTIFPIPDRIRFVRTASYWRFGATPHNVWYDNGWNFFGADWSPRGACCWNLTTFGEARTAGPGAVFSGDPTNTKDIEGRACQLIDLYLDRLVELGVTYAVWNVLCYSRIAFSGAAEVHAALQWGEEPQSGKLFEPSRCQLSFPLHGDNMTKFVAYLDLGRREVVYLDANLPAKVSSAGANGPLLAGTMPAYVEYLGSLPSVHDLFRYAPAAVDGMPVVYDDTDLAIAGGPAYVFRPSNPDSTFEPVDPATLL
jgi:hypothetical protein